MFHLWYSLAGKNTERHAYREINISFENIYYLDNLEGFAIPVLFGISVAIQ